MIKHHLAEDTIDQEDIDHLIDWLKTYPRLTKGNVTVEFEKKWSDWLGSTSRCFATRAPRQTYSCTAPSKNPGASET